MESTAILAIMNDQSSAYVLFLGTGTSEYVPRMSCLTNTDPNDEICQTCFEAAKPNSKSRRRNCSILISKRTDPDERARNVLIDCGKSFYDSCLNFFPPNQIRVIDSIVLTHQHADHMMGGLDDARDFTLNLKETKHKPLPIYLNAQTMERVEQVYPYIVDSRTAQSIVPKCSFITIDPKLPFQAANIRLIPLQVEHGSIYALGFRFGDVSYIPDVSRIPEEVMELMKGTKVLIIDALNPVGKNKTHFCLDDALETAKQLKPEKVYLVDMTHRWKVHEEANAELAQLDLGFSVELAFDGLKIDVSHLGV